MVIEEMWEESEDFGLVSDLIFFFFGQDISNGEENVPITGVNSLDNVEPQPLTYCNVRLPTEHVPLNLDPEFLVCCDCVDDCQVSLPLIINVT